jgi:DNA mismatch repair ATPase MutS
MNKKQIEDLLKKVSEIEELAKAFFQKVQVKYSPTGGGSVVVIGFSDYSWVEPSGDTLNAQLELIDKYEDWYSQTSKIISNIMPSRKPDLVDLYEKNKDIIELKEQIWSQDKSKFENNLLRNLGKQKSMLSSTLSMINIKPKEGKEEKKGDNNIESNNYGQPGLDISMYVDLKSQMTILSQQYSRIESDIKDLAQKIEGIGRITINNLNQNTAKTGNISISNENLVKWVKPDLDDELKKLKEELQSKDVEGSDKEIIDDLIETVLKEKNPKLEWLKDKISKIKYWGNKAGLLIGRLKELADAIGITEN